MGHLVFDLFILMEEFMVMENIYFWDVFDRLENNYFAEVNVDQK